MKKMNKMNEFYCSIEGDIDLIQLYDNKPTYYYLPYEMISLNETNYNPINCKCYTDTGNCQVEYYYITENDDLQKLYLEYTLMNDLKNTRFETIYPHYKSYIEKKYRMKLPESIEYDIFNDVISFSSQKNIYYIPDSLSEEEKNSKEFKDCLTQLHNNNTMAFSECEKFLKIESNSPFDNKIYNTIESILDNEDKNKTVYSTIFQSEFYPLYFKSRVPRKNKDNGIVIGNFQLTNIIECKGNEKKYIMTSYVRNGYQDLKNFECDLSDIKEIKAIKEYNTSSSHKKFKFIMNFILIFTYLFLYIIN